MSDVSFDNVQTHNPDLRDYYALLKPRVMRLVVFTALVGMIIAPASINPVLGFVAVLSIALGAGASGALNMYIDSDIDKIMARTKSRPIPAGKVPREHALVFGVFLSFVSVGMLGLYTNWFAAAFLAFTIFFYVVIYSLGLKRRTPQNIVIGGASGAFPPMIGWAAATGGISLESVMMFLVIFLWTPPHFWALALFRNDDYSAAKVPMMPVVKGEAHTRLQIFIYSLLLAFAAILTAFTHIGGPIVAIVATFGSVGMVRGGYLLWKGQASDGFNDGFRAEKRYFFFSIAFLFAFFLALLAEYALGLFVDLSAISQVIPVSGIGG